MNNHISRLAQVAGVLLALCLAGSVSAQLKDTVQILCYIQGRTNTNPVYVTDSATTSLFFVKKKVDTVGATQPAIFIKVPLLWSGSIKISGLGYVFKPQDTLIKNILENMTVTFYATQIVGALPANTKNKKENKSYKNLYDLSGRKITDTYSRNKLYVSNNLSKYINLR